MSPIIQLQNKPEGTSNGAFGNGDLAFGVNSSAFTGFVPSDNFTNNNDLHTYEVGEYWYNSNDETYHHYDNYSQAFCEWGSENCTSEIRDDVLSKYSRPTYKLEPKSVANPGEIVNAYYSGLPMFGDVDNPEDYTKVIGPILQQKLGSGVYRNITLEGHEMHPGEIIRKWVNINGYAHIRTHGVGLNKSESFLRNDSKLSYLGRSIERFKAGKNDELGPEAFKTMDIEAYKYWRKNYGN